MQRRPKAANGVDANNASSEGALGPPVTEARVPEIRSISAATLATSDMVRAVRFYEALGFSMAKGGETSAFTSFHVGKGYLNLARASEAGSRSGRMPKPHRAS